MKTISKELIGATTIPFILTLLDNGESYGYEIIKKVKEVSNNHIEWVEGSLYPVLHKLEKNGLIKSYWKMADNGRHRKYYAINKKGRKALRDEIANWEMVNDMMKEQWKDLEAIE